jgi:chromosome segregation protein
MRLQSLKLAGFKSFVEPTELFFPSNLVGIVGPNGCGKSNTIDAVRWVMGESSAKNLRGEESNDVIFNGSANRRAVSQAAVELIFNNESGRLGGEFAAYREVSLRREISRDGESRYFLNSQRCRKRDISDVLLGTGLGPRSYAIIEQGMISRFIEAKPEELRLYLEEAAGISKYKERRRESENHLRQTEAHLLRLRDLKNELEQRVIHLEAQAEQAKRYQALQQEQATAEQTSLGLRFLLLQHQRQQLTQQHDLQKTLVKDLQIALESVEREQEALQEIQALNQEGLQQQQNELTRLQQKLQHLEQKLRQEENQVRELTQRQRYQQERLEQIEKELKNLEIKQKALQTSQPAFLATDNPFGQEKRNLQQQYQKLDYEIAEGKAKQSLWQETLTNLDNQINRLQQQQQQLEKRQQRLLERQQQHPLAEKQQQLRLLQQEADTTSAEKNQHQEEIIFLEQNLATQAAALEHERKQLEQKEQERQKLTQREQIIRAQLALLEPPENQAWLYDLGFDQAPRLEQVIEIKDKNWQNALAQLLTPKRRALLLPQLSRLPPAPPPGTAYYLQLPDQQDFSRQRHNEATDSEVAWQRQWQDKIVLNPWLSPWLAAAMPVEDLASVWTTRHTLPEQHFYIDAQGRCLGKNWCYFPGKEASHWFDLQEEIKEIQPKLQQQEQDCQILRSRKQQSEATLQALQEELIKKKQHQQLVEKSLWQNRSQQENLAQTLTLYQQQASALATEAEELSLDLINTKEELFEYQQRKADWQKNQAETIQQQQQAVAILVGLGQRLQDIEKKWQDHEDAQQQARILAAERRSQEQAIIEQSEKLRKERAAIEEEQLKQQEIRAEIQPIIDSLADDIAALLEEKQQIEALLQEQQRLQNQQQQQWQTLEKKKNQKWQELQREQQILQSIDLQNERLSERENAILEQWPSDVALPEVLHHLSNMYPEVTAQEKFLKIFEKKQKEAQQALAALGLVNLAAIAEFAEQKNRLDYLKAQEQDIDQAFQQLQGAIAKLDSETETRFKNTFTAVDARLRERFPRLFGGGEAYLELTSDNFLETGIRIMARPPGKKLSSIHLMSGGEKALTAIAIVFSIFELNPAPFCLLDEVDAPLDEANVGRFCAMVEEMSEQVQFIFISHNKRTMAMAKQLLGVTMREPGISRLVSVDLQQALTLAQP